VKVLLVSLFLLVQAASAYGETEATDALPSMGEQLEVVDELSKLDVLIAATEESLKRQKLLKERLKNYYALEKACIANPKDTKKLLELVVSAKQVLDDIQNAYIEDYFRPEFIEELQKLAKIGEKKNIPPAQ
jgi:hypothetical protein